MVMLENLTSDGDGDKLSKPCKAYHRAGTALESAGEEEVAAGPWAPRAGFAKFIPGGAAAAWSF